jgi:hypothetical protein
MPKNTQLGSAAINAQADALAALLNDGFLCIYSGAQPASADAPLDSQKALALLRFGTPAADAAADGVVKFHAIASAQAKATGTATWFRTYRADQKTPVFDGTADQESAAPNLSLSTCEIAAGALVTVSRFVHVVPKA